MLSVPSFALREENVSVVLAVQLSIYLHDFILE